MALPFWSESDLIDLAGVDAVLTAFDPENTGTPEAGSIARLQADCDALILSGVRGSRSQASLDAAIAAPSPVLKRLSLQWALAQVWKKSPTHGQAKWMDLEKSIRQELEAIDVSDLRLDIASGDPTPANVGGKVFNAAGSVVCPPVKFFVDGMGDF